jgi:hypothetical protein
MVRLRRARNALAVFVLLGGLLFFGLMRCPMALLFHVPCPGCGLTRATLRLAAGDLPGAIHFHPLVLLVVPLFAAFFGTNSVMYVRTGEWGWVERNNQRWVTLLAGALIVLAIGVWIARFLGYFGGPAPV